MPGTHKVAAFLFAYTCRGDARSPHEVGRNPIPTFGPAGILDSQSSSQPRLPGDSQAHPAGAVAVRSA